MLLSPAGINGAARCATPINEYALMSSEVWKPSREMLRNGPCSSLRSAKAMQWIR